MTFRSATIVCLLLVGSAPVIAQWTPPPGWVLVDDMVVPAWAVQEDSAYSGTPWTGGTVYYTFSSNVNTTNRTRAIQAMGEIAGIADVTFVERTTQPNYIVFQDSNVNSSFVGMIGGSQTVNIANWSFRYIICHEIFHALSYMHEHQRPGRDTYVTINWSNISSSATNNFTLRSGVTVGAYDFYSIMHYDDTSFTTNGQPTISANSGYTQYQGVMGNRNYMSILDAQGIAARYGAPPAPGITSVTPSSFSVGAGTQVITIDGTRFLDGASSANGVMGSVVQWNGMNVSTSYVSPTRLTAIVPSTYFSSSGCADLTVNNPSPGGGVSAVESIPIGAQNCSSLPQWQLNSFFATCHFDGAATTSPVGPPAIVNKGFNEPTVLTYSSFPNVYWEAMVSVLPVVPANAGGATITGGGMINIDLSDPALGFFNSGGPIPSIQVFPGVINLPFNTPSFPLTVSTQMGIVNPTYVLLSQASQLVVEQNPCPLASTLTLGNDDSIVRNLGFNYTFYGTSYTQVHVGSNGYVTFGQPFTNPQVGPFALWTGPPRIAGLLTDLDPSSSGSVGFYTDSASSFAVCWNSVPNVGQSNANTFRIEGSPNLVEMSFGTLASTTATVGMGPGGFGGSFQSIDLSAAGATAITQLLPYEHFTAGVDLVGLTLQWTMANGVPVQVQ